MYLVASAFRGKFYAAVEMCDGELSVMSPLNMASIASSEVNGRTVRTSNSSERLTSASAASTCSLCLSGSTRTGTSADSKTARDVANEVFWNVVKP